jgi:phosphoribosylglycinamide formyltransferase-1
MHRVAVLISGRGSLLEPLIRRVHADAAVPGEIVGVVSNRPHAPGLEVARDAGLTTAVVDHRAFDGREPFEAVLATTLEGLGAELVVCAGFMRILTAGFVTRFAGRMLNVHPSLLPDFPGLDTHRRALERGDADAGTSVHLVTPELDAGPILAQARVATRPDDSPDSLAERVVAAERRLYPEVVAWVTAGRLALDADPPRLDGRPLPPRGVGHRFTGDRLQPCTPDPPTR